MAALQILSLGDYTDGTNERDYYFNNYHRIYFFCFCTYINNRFDKKDSTGEIMSKVRRGKALMSRRYVDLFNTYAPFTGALYSPFPKDSDYEDNKIIFTLVGEDSLDNFPCFHVQMIKFPDYDSIQILHNIETKYDYWIHKK